MIITHVFFVTLHQARNDYYQVSRWWAGRSIAFLARQKVKLCRNGTRFLSKTHACYFASVFDQEIGVLLFIINNVFHTLIPTSTSGLVVEQYPATVQTRVRFPAGATIFLDVDRAFLGLSYDSYPTKFLSLSLCLFLNGPEMHTVKCYPIL